jgi:hypothetical protein
MISIRHSIPAVLRAVALFVLGTSPWAQTLALDCQLPDGRHYVATIDGSKPWVTFKGPPTGSPKDSEILGVNVYRWEVLARDRSGAPLVVGADLLLSNAFANPDGSGHTGAVYFRHITANAGKWVVTYDVSRWPAPFVIGPPPEGGDHLWLSGVCTVRRVALFRGVGEGWARALLDAVPKIDASSPTFEDGVAWPALSSEQLTMLEQRFAGKLAAFRAAFAAGKPDPGNDLRVARIGFQHPTGNVTVAYEHGGQAIHFAWGWEQTPSAALYWRLAADAGIERQRIVRDRTTGARLTPELFAAGKGKDYQPFSLSLTGDAEYADTEGRHISLPPCLDVAPFNSGDCKREAEIRRIRSHDDAHMIRSLGPKYAAARLCGDRVARELLIDEGNFARMAYCDIGEPAGQWRSGVPTLVSRLKEGQASPSFGRACGWASTAMAWSSNFSPADSPEQLAFQRNGRALLRVRTLAAPQHGIAQRATFGGVQGAWDPFAGGGGAVPKDRAIAQSFEAALQLGGEICLLDEIAPVSGELAVIARAGLTLYDNAACPTRPVPWKYLDVGPASGPAALEVARGWNVKETPNGDASHVRRTLAWLWLTTEDAKFLELLLLGKTAQARRDEFMQIALSGESWRDPDGAAEAAAVMQQAVTRSPR